MKLTCNRSELLTALLGVSKAVSTKSTIPALEGILLKCGEYNLTLTAYDLEMSITTVISAEISDPIDLILNAKLFLEMARKMESDVVTIQVGSDLRTTVRCGSARFVILGTPAEDFPELTYPEEENRLSLPCNILKKMIDKTLYAVSTSDQKPAHTGTKFIIDGTSLTMVSVDGFRLALCRKDEMSLSQSMTFIVPGRTLGELSRLIGDSDENVEISMARRYAVFHLREYTIMTRLLEDEFLDYTKSIPSGYKTRIRISAALFFDAVERASLLITERFQSPLRMRFENGCVTISCSTAQGNSTDIVDCFIDGDDIEIGFNSKYIMDALRYSGCDEVYLEMNSSTMPVKILPVDSPDDFIFLVLPVRINLSS